MGRLEPQRVVDALKAGAFDVLRRRDGREFARTAVVNVVVIVEIAYLLNCRSLNHSPFSIGFFPTGR